VLHWDEKLMEEKMKALSFYTTSRNTGSKNGAFVLFATS